MVRMLSGKVYMFCVMKFIVLGDLLMPKPDFGDLIIANLCH